MLEPVRSTLTELAVFLREQWRTNPEARVVVVVVAAAIFLLFFLAAAWIERLDRDRLYPKGLTRGDSLPEVRTSGSKPRGPVYIPLGLGSVTVDLQPTSTDTIHTLISGTSGLGKSTAVLPLLDLPIGVLVVALDNTRPIRQKIHAMGGKEWTNHPEECALGLNLLRGRPLVASELIVAGLPKADGDTGLWRRAARVRIKGTLEACDARGIERNWPDIIRALWLQTGDNDADKACRNWASKLEQVYMLLGPTLGTDLDLVEEMRAGHKVLCRVNRFLSPEDAPMIGGWLMVYARVVAAEAGVPFILIVEEAGQMGLFREYISPIAQAARDREVPLVGITQNPSKLPDEVTNNCSVHVSFAHELDSEQRFMARMLRLHPSQLYREAFPRTKRPENQGRGWCYVRAPGLPTTLVNLPMPAKEERSLSKPSAVSPAGSAQPEWVQPPPRVLVPQLDGWIPNQLALDVPQAERPQQELPPEWLGQDRTYRRWWIEQCQRAGTPSILWSPNLGLFYAPRGCLEWTGGLTRPANGAPARPRSSYHRKHATPYRVFFRLAYGHDPDPTADHLCDNPICCDPEHLEACGIDENNKRQAQRTRVFELAGWTRVNRAVSGQRISSWVGEMPVAA